MPDVGPSLCGAALPRRRRRRSRDSHGGTAVMSGMIPAAKPLIGDEEREAVDAVLRSGGLAGGPQVAAFEQEFSRELVAGRYCVAVNSGTAGSHLGLLA